MLIYFPLGSGPGTHSVPFSTRSGCGEEPTSSFGSPGTRELSEAEHWAAGPLEATYFILWLPGAVISLWRSHPSNLTSPFFQRIMTEGLGAADL